MQRHRGSKGCWKNSARRVTQRRGTTSLQFAKKKKKKCPADFGSAVEWSSMSRLPVSQPSPLRRAPTAPWSGHACGFLRKDTQEVNSAPCKSYGTFSLSSLLTYSARAQTSKLENHFPLKCWRCCSILPDGGGVWSCRSSETSFVLPGDVGFPLSWVLNFMPQTCSKVLGDFPESYLCLALPHCLVYILEFLLVVFFFFLTWTIFEVFIGCYNTASVLRLHPLAVR